MHDEGVGVGPFTHHSCMLFSLCMYLSWLLSQTRRCSSLPVVPWWVSSTAADAKAVRPFVRSTSTAAAASGAGRGRGALSQARALDDLQGPTPCDDDDPSHHKFRNNVASTHVGCAVWLMDGADDSVILRSQDLATHLSLPLLCSSINPTTSSINAGPELLVEEDRGGSGTHETTTLSSRSAPPPLSPAGGEDDLLKLSHALVYSRYSSPCKPTPLALVEGITSPSQYALGIVPLVIPHNKHKSETTKHRRRQRRLQIPSATNPEADSVQGVAVSGFKPSTPPFTVDFVAALRQGGGSAASQSPPRPGKDLLVQAVFGKKHFARYPLGGRTSSNNGMVAVVPSVVDLTAGWGTDAMVLLRAGVAHVTLVERHPIVAALLRDGHRRLKELEDWEGIPIEQRYSSRIQIVEGDSVRVAAQLLSKATATSVDSSSSSSSSSSPSCSSVWPTPSETPPCLPIQERPHVVYLDPMFPPRTKSAAVKKNMQILHSLLATTTPVGAGTTIPSEQQPHHHDDDNVDEAALLQAALSLAQARVVVKRPLHLPTGLADSTPSYSVKGSTHRWDVYLIK